MSLKIIDPSGVDLAAQPPLLKTVNSTTLVGGRAYVQCRIIEDGGMLYDRIAGTLSWNDGTVPIVYTGAGTISVSEYRDLVPGQYVARMDAHNYRMPAPEAVSINFGFTVKPSRSVSSKTPLLYGPILPKDAGFPNTDQWAWNTGKDIEVLSSSVKMLLLTAKGDRIMLPDYGTSIKNILFEVRSAGVESMLQNEISTALARWEPRVAIESIAVVWTGDRDVTVTALFTSRLDMTTFEIPMNFQQ